ncbi:MAG TPA: GTP-binding protein [Myxococcota bacterium]|nr:GTP-binding protein [Myxococcota bacterium]
MAEAPDQPIAATILSGFLGSGKTTLLNWLLCAPHGRRIAVVVNEFGAVGIDGSLVAGGEQFVQLDNGCLCCALNEDLDATLRGLMERGGFDHVVVETTGLADPLPVAWAFTRPGLSCHFRVDSIATVVDAGALDRALLEATEPRLQIQRADLLILNKCDQTDDEGAAAEAKVRQMNPAAPLVKGTHGQVPWDFILGAHVRAADTPDHEAHGHAHGASFETWTFEIDAVIPDRRLEDFVYEVPESVYRFKGLVRTVGDLGPWTLVNAVAGRIDVRPCTPARPPARPCLVFIGKDLDVPALEALCQTLTAP